MTGFLVHHHSIYSFFMAVAPWNCITKHRHRNSQFKKKKKYSLLANTAILMVFFGKLVYRGSLINQIILYYISFWGHKGYQKWCTKCTLFPCFNNIDFPKNEYFLIKCAICNYLFHSSPHLAILRYKMMFWPLNTAFY